MKNSFSNYLNQQLTNDPEFRAEYEALDPARVIMQAIIDARKTRGITQKQLSDITGIHQADISKLENGSGNPSLSTLTRLAKGMGMTLRVEFVPSSNNQ